MSEQISISRADAIAAILSLRSAADSAERSDRFRAHDLNAVADRIAEAIEEPASGGVVSVRLVNHPLDGLWYVLLWAIVVVGYFAQQGKIF